MPAGRREKRTEAPQKKNCSHRSPEIARWEEKNANKRAAEKDMFASRTRDRPRRGGKCEQNSGIGRFVRIAGREMQKKTWKEVV
jgi:hypothetical protein